MQTSELLTNLVVFTEILAVRCSADTIPAIEAKQMALDKIDEITAKAGNPATPEIASVLRRVKLAARATDNDALAASMRNIGSDTFLLLPPEKQRDVLEIYPGRFRHIRLPAAA